MKSFQSFQPGKSRSIGFASALIVSDGTDFSNDKPKEISMFKSLFLQLNNNPFELSIAPSELKDTSIQKAAPKNYTSTRTVSMEPMSCVQTSNASLLRQITIEANFDLQSIIEELKPNSNVRALDSDTYIYPSSQRPAENYVLAEYVASHICKPRHWTAREIDLPYSSSLHSSTDSTGGGIIMLGSTSSMVTSAAATSGSGGGAGAVEDTLLAVESRLLKWQNAMHALLTRLVNGSNDISDRSICASTDFYVLGRSVVLPASTRLHLGGTTGTLPLPYTSAHFFTTSKLSELDTPSATTKMPIKVATKITTKTKTKTKTAVLASAGGVAPCDACLEPACLLIGVQKALLIRLQQMHAIFLLVEDVNSPLPLTKAEMSARGKSAAINIAHGKASIDPHSSTAALFNSRKLGVDILLKGKYSVSVAAQVLKESVFDILQLNSSRANPTDVPVLLAHSAFPHCSHVSYDIRPLQCQYNFNDTTKSGTTSDKNALRDASSSNRTSAAFHKIQINGLLRSAVLPTLVRSLEKHAALCSIERKSPTRKKVCSAYAYLVHKDSSDRNIIISNDKEMVPSKSQGASDGDVFKIGASKPAPVVISAPINPMVLVTATSANYAEEDEEDDEEDDDTHKKEEENEFVRDNSTPRKRDHSTTISRESSVKKKVKTGQSTAHSQSMAGVEKDDNSDNSSNIGNDGGGMRAEEWLRMQRDAPRGGDYFLIQCSLMTPRMAQFSYARSDGDADYPDASDEGNNTSETLFSLLNPTHLIEEVRWSSNNSKENGSGTTHKAETEMKDVLVEVVRTVMPPARLRRILPESSAVSSSHEANEADDMENGVVLNALNKYSIFVDNEVM